MAGRTRFVRIPRHLLHASLDDLPGLGVPESAHSALRALLADLPAVPQSPDSAVLVGQPEVTLPCMAVLARHVTQGLRDHNIALMHDRSRLQTERLKLVFLAGAELAALIDEGERRLEREAVLFTLGAPPAVLALLASRERAGHASFVAVEQVPPVLANWRQVSLTV